MIYRFDRCVLDVPRRELTRDGSPVALRPKVFALLVLLIEERERVVDRDTLFERLWPGRVVSDATLSSCVKELRGALGDTARERRCVRTVHGQGFRFVAAVALAETASADAASGPDPSDLPAVPHGPVVDAPSSAHPPAPPPAPSPPDPPPASPARSSDAGRAERKAVSALRCALLRPDESAERLGPERMHHLMRTLLALVAETVGRYDGQVTQWLSDGCLALFGVPRAHDDDARRAVLAAGDIHARCRALGEEHGVAFACGVTSDRVVVGGVPGRPEQHYCASGALLGEAERLCFAAGNGEVAISAGTYRLVRGDVRVQPLGAAALPGAWLVRSLVGERAGVPRRFRRPVAPLIGRARQTALLAERLADARAGAGQAVALVGAAGIGKTRLLEEFVDSFDAFGDSPFAGGSVTVVRCLPQHRHAPDHALTVCLRELCGVRADDDGAIAAERVHAALRRAGVGEAEAREPLAALLRCGDGSAPDETLSPRARREILATSLQRLVFATDVVRVLVVEDLQWIDPSSAAWLGALVQRMGNQRLLLLASYRTGTTPDWLRHAAVTQLPLAPLPAADAERLLGALRGVDHDAATTARIVESGGGNPFLLHELAFRPDDGEPMPDTVQAVLTARIDELDGADKRALQIASVLGLRVREELLIAACDAPSDEVRESLARLQGHDLLGVEFDAGNGYRPHVAFRHALVQEAAYAMLLADERERLHRRVVHLIDTVFADEGRSSPEILAPHCERGGLPKRAARLWQRAAWDASVRCAYVETAHFVERGLALLPEAGSPGATSGGSTADGGASPGPRPLESAELELALLRSLGHAQMATHGYASAEVGSTWTRAERLCEELGDDVSRFRVLIGLGNYRLVSGDLTEVLPINRRLVRIARRERGVAMRIRAKAAMGELMVHLGRTHSAVRHLESCLALVERSASSCFLGHSAAVLAESHLSWARDSLGHAERALLHGERALGTAHASGKPFLLAMALAMNAELHRFRDDPTCAAARARAAIDIAARQRFTHWHGLALTTLGWSEARRGDTGAGLEAVERGVALSRATDERLLLPVKLGVLADVQRLHGRGALARRTLEQACELAGRTGERFCLFGLWRVRALLGDARPGSDEGEDGANGVAGGSRRRVHDGLGVDDGGDASGRTGAVIDAWSAPGPVALGGRKQLVPASCPSPVGS